MWIVSEIPLWCQWEYVDKSVHLYRIIEYVTF